MNKNLVNGTIKTVPKKWNKDEIILLKELKNKNYSYKKISKILNRSEISVSIKYKRITKNNNTYNKKHVKQKYLLNEIFIKKIMPKSILDVYAGKSFYKKNQNSKNLYVVDNDIKEKCDYNLNAIDLLYKFKSKKFDIVDLDPYGSAFECFDFVLQIAEKGIIITFGEYGHLRWNRIDFVEHRYDINNKSNFIAESFINYIKKRALIHNKVLKVELLANFKNILRVYFSITKIKKTISGKKYFE
jgi:hypothetical protein